MRVRLITICLVSVGLECSAQAAPRLGNFPWAPEVQCKLNSPKPQGLHPDAYSALQSLALSHRITQGINHSSDRGNVHDTDGTINGNAYTGAVDISVRCLTAVQIKALLGRLAALGFAVVSDMTPAYDQPIRSRFVPASPC